MAADRDDAARLPRYAVDALFPLQFADRLLGAGHRASNGVGDLPVGWPFPMRRIIAADEGQHLVLP